MPRSVVYALEKRGLEKDFQRGGLEKEQNNSEVGESRRAAAVGIQRGSELGEG